jgi:hypothetical protein
MGEGTVTATQHVALVVLIVLLLLYVVAALFKGKGRR